MLTFPFRGLVRLITRALIVLRKKEIILVFGMSRSGTTMFGRFLSLAPATQYAHEPAWKLMSHVFIKRHGLFDRDQFWGQFIPSEDQRSLKVHCLVCATLRSVLTSGRDTQTICIKSVTLNDVLSQAVCAIKPKHVIYISRHPCGRSESILRQLDKDLSCDPDSVTQESLEQLGRGWGKMNSEVKRSFDGHPQWKWLLFENLTRDPVSEFRKLYDDLGLEWNETIHHKILSDTQAKNGSFYSTKRDSRKEADKWRDVLTEEQIQSIRNGSLPFETNLYESF